jgi:hypothetical protein
LIFEPHLRNDSILIQVNGHWKLSFLYQQLEAAPVNCSNVQIETDSNGENKTIIVESTVGGEPLLRLLRGQRSSVSTPARFNVFSHLDGLVGMHFDIIHKKSSRVVRNANVRKPYLS